MPAEPLWTRIAAEHYGLKDIRLVRPIQRFSRHYVLATHTACFVLSQVDRTADRVPFSLQFDILDLLRDSGVSDVRAPRSTRDGARFVTGPEHYWFLRDYRPTDLVFWRYEPQLIKQAAVSLARIHSAGAGAHIRRFNRGRLAPFYRSVEHFLDTLDRIMRSFDDGQLTPDDRDLLKRTLYDLDEDRAAVLGECRERHLIGITHHDYRPDNILVKGGRIAEIIDWDCAFVDHQMYDVAYAAFQFGQRQRLGDTDIAYVRMFTNAYLHARGVTGLSDRALTWFYQFAVVKRLLINGRNAERVRLLRTLEESERPETADIPRSPADLLPTANIAQRMAI